MIAFLTSSVFLTSVLPGVLSGVAVNALRVSGHPAAAIAARLLPQLVERLRGGRESAEPSEADAQSSEATTPKRKASRATR